MGHPVGTETFRWNESVHMDAQAELFRSENTYRREPCQGARAKMMKNGANMDTIRQMMGHTDFKILRTYMHLTSDDVKSEHETHSPLLTLLPQSTKKLRAI